MDDLITWLRAQLDEDERVAREASAGAGDGEWLPGPGSVRGVTLVEIAEARGSCIPHIARWDPARVLAEIKAKRRILDEYEREDLTMSPDYWVALASVISHLAQPYAGRVGWREEWAYDS